MIKNIISLALLVVSVFLSFKHGWDSWHFKDNPESVKMMTDLGINKTLVPFLSIFMLIVGLLLMFPKTYFIGNLLNAISILIIMALAINAGNLKMALIEIPFLAMPLLMIWLKYPFKS